MRPDTRKAGAKNEARAATFLKRRGFKMIGRNVKTDKGEIDIIALHRGVICFVEVRSRTGPEAHFEALASVDRRKQRRLSRLAAAFLKEQDLLNRPARFDVVSVAPDDPIPIVHIPDAFPVTGVFL
jgi:putative endonuclease